MDSDSGSTPNPHHPLSLTSSASKLPIKRKTPVSSFLHPNPNLDHITTGEDDGGGDRNPPPFKFHRIWTEPDEIRFLQGLLNSSCSKLYFPRDLNVFYSKFSETTSHPYTKSQLSEKLRRLRRKFRVVSSRLARGLDRAMLSPHDRALFDLSKQLWHPDFSSTSPFFAFVKQNKSNLIGFGGGFSRTLEINNHSVLNRIGDDGDNHDQDFEDDNAIDGDFYVENGIDVKLSEVNVELDNAVVQEQNQSLGSGSVAACGGGGGSLGCGLGVVVAKTVVNVFDQSLKEVRMALIRDQGSDQPVDDFQKRWRDQRVTELDVFARRLRLVLEHSLQRK